MMRRQLDEKAVGWFRYQALFCCNLVRLRRRTFYISAVMYRYKYKRIGVGNFHRDELPSICVVICSLDA